MQTAVRYTPEDLLAMEDGHCYDLVHGQLVERHIGAESSRIAQVINQRLGLFVDSHRLGLVWGPDCGYQIFADDPHKVRYPDGSFVARGRLPDEQPPRGHMRLPADLMIEVVSPHDLAWEIDQKVDEFLRAGVRLVWVLYPDTCTILIYHPGSEVTRLSKSDDLSGEDVLPGFTCPVSELFPTRAMPKDV
jgi:Uma2 family endonuclease